MKRSPRHRAQTGFEVPKTTKFKATALDENKKQNSRKEEERN